MNAYSIYFSEMSYVYMYIYIYIMSIKSWVDFFCQFFHDFISLTLTCICSDKQAVVIFDFFFLTSR